MRDLRFSQRYSYGFPSSAIWCSFTWSLKPVFSRQCSVIIFMLWNVHEKFLPSMMVIVVCFETSGTDYLLKQLQIMEYRNHKTQSAAMFREIIWVHYQNLKVFVNIVCGWIHTFSSTTVGDTNTQRQHGNTKPVNNIYAHKVSKGFVWLTNYLKSWMRDLPENLTRPQPLKKFPAICGPRRFITAFTRARQLSLSHTDPIHVFISLLEDPF
jgi:hypothetical protein